MSSKNTESNDHTNTSQALEYLAGKKFIIITSSALFVAAMITIFSGYSSTFARTYEFNELKTRVVILETNYANIISLLEDIKEQTE